MTTDILRFCAVLIATLGLIITACSNLSGLTMLGIGLVAVAGFICWDHPEILED